MLNNLSFDIIEYICDFINFNSQINFTNINKTYNKKRFITNLYTKYSLTNDILKKYPYIKRLNLNNNKYVNDISYLTRIIKLDISGFCIIEQHNINHLNNLIELDTSNNININNLSKFEKLEIIHLNGICNITSNEINKLSKLKHISFKYNPFYKEIIDNLQYNISIEL